MPKFIGRKGQLAEIQKRISQSGRTYLISLSGRGGVGKTFMLRQVHELYGHKRGMACFPLVDFSQSKTRTLAWLMDFISQNAPLEFSTYLNEKRREADPGDDPQARSFSQDEIEQAFLHDFSLLEAQTRCIFLFDTLELVQDTLLFYFILQLVKTARNSIFILAGRRNQELRQRFEEALPGGTAIPVDLVGFDLPDALEYIKSHPAGRDLPAPQQEALYLLAECGLPIKLALALDWLSRRLMMESLAHYSIETLKQFPPAGLEAAQVEFERELVAQIAALGTDVDQAVYLMAHVNRRFNRELLGALLPQHETSDLVAHIRGLDFVKSIEEDYFVLHDEIQRMITRHVWDANDPTHEQRREISLKVIGYYNRKIEETGKQPGLNSLECQRERHILEIERLYYELDVNLADGYQQFKKLFKELEGQRNIELAALALDTLLKERSLPPLLYTFINAFYRGWVLVRRQQLQAAVDWVSKGLASLEDEAARFAPQTPRGRFLEQEVEHRQGELHTLLGYCYRLSGHWEVAVNELERARALHESLIAHLQAQQPRDGQAIQDAVARLAETLNDIANLQRMQGNMDDARLYCKSSLLIREALKDERAAGHCCYVMGMIMWETGNTSEALQYMQRARNYYEATGSLSLARAWVDRYEAFILFRTGNLERALLYLDRAVDETSRNPGLQDEHAEVLILYSRIYRQRKAPGDLERACEKAAQALQVAQRVRNQYRVSEAYITLCGALNELARWQPEKARPAEMREALQKGAALAHANKYRRLEAVILDNEADLEFEQKNYLLAFDKYTEACQKAIEFKAAVFERALSKLGHRLYALLQLDLNQTISICRRILEAWKETPHHADYPDFKEEVEEIRDLAQTRIKRRDLLQTFEKEFRRGSWPTALKTCAALDDFTGSEYPERAENYFQRARLENSRNYYTQARMYCERAIRILEHVRGSPSLLGQCYLLLSQVYWKLGNTAEAAIHLDDAQKRFAQARDELGQRLVQLERGYMYFRTQQFEEANRLLLEVRQAFEEAHEPIYLASALNLLGRIARVDVRHADRREIGYDEASQRSQEAMEVLEDRDWFVSAEIHLTQSILHLTWNHLLQRRGNQAEAQKHYRLSRSYHQKGWRKIEKIDTPLLKSVYSGIRGKLAEIEGDEPTARQSYLDELDFATRTKQMRLLRALDLLENWLAKKSPDETVQAARWLIEHWQADPERARHFPQVLDSLEWMRDHRRYIPEVK